MKQEPILLQIVIILFSLIQVLPSFQKQKGHFFEWKKGLPFSKKPLHLVFFFNGIPVILKGYAICKVKKQLMVDSWVFTMQGGPFHL